MVVIARVDGAGHIGPIAFGIGIAGDDDFVCQHAAVFSAHQPLRALAADVGDFGLLMDVRAQLRGGAGQGVGIGKRIHRAAAQIQ